jgi:transcriptional regulator with XRE-family HTH domain
VTDVGVLIKDWRERRRLSQLELANEAGVSARHLSFIETGRSKPTSQMILRLAEELDVPLRAQNQLLLAGGFAPAHEERAVTDLSVVNDAIEAIIQGHLPYPALAVDLGWELVAGNDAMYAMAALAAPHLMEPPVNVIRVTLHPDGLAPYIVNLAQWRRHLVERLHADYAANPDPRLRELLDEIATYPGGGEEAEPSGGLVVPMQLRVGDQVLSMFSTTTVFGTPREVTVSELAIEAFYPADEATRSFFLGVSPGEAGQKGG